MAALLGVTTGLLSARLRGRVDWAVRGLNGFLVAVPNFVVATLIVLLVGLIVVLVNLAVDVAYARVDARVSYD
jgi:ABC-type dipeptide/oligopeptide/nickel transport system permease component